MRPLPPIPIFILLSISFFTYTVNIHGQQTCSVTPSAPGWAIPFCDLEVSFEVDVTFDPPSQNIVQWDFGDDSPLQNNGDHIYAEPGTYEICVTAMNMQCSDTYCQSITVNDAAPVFDNCPNDISLEIDDFQSCTNNNYSPMVTAKRCGSILPADVACTRSDGAALTDTWPEGATGVVCVATDPENQLTDTCSWQVDVEGCEGECMADNVPTFSSVFPVEANDQLADMAADVLQNSEGKYVVLGLRQNEIGTDNEMNMTFTVFDEYGNISLPTTVIDLSDGNNPTYTRDEPTGMHIIELFDLQGASDGYAVCATYRGIGEDDVVLAKLNENGCVVWAEHFTEFNDTEDYALGLFQENNGDISLFIKKKISPELGMLSLVRTSTDGTSCEHFDYSGTAPGGTSDPVVLPTAVTRINVQGNGAAYAVLGHWDGWSTLYFINDDLSTFSYTYFTAIGLLGEKQIQSVAHDGDYLLVAGMVEEGDIQSVFITKMEAFGGGIPWAKKYDVSGLMQGTFLVSYVSNIGVLPSGNYIISGMVGEESISLKPFLMETAPNGEVLWLRHYDAGNFSGFTAGSLTNDGGQILVGLSQTPTDDTPSSLIIKTDASGQMHECVCFADIEPVVTNIGGAFGDSHSIQKEDVDCIPSGLNFICGSVPPSQSFCGQYIPIGDNCDVNTCHTDTLRINTGYNHFLGELYDAPGQDAFWTVCETPWANVSVPYPAYVINAHTAWDALSGSQWISAFPTPDYEINNESPAPPYTLKNCFCICEDSSEINIDFEVLVDDSVYIYLAHENGAIIDELIAHAGHDSSRLEQVHESYILDKGNYCIRAEMRNIGEVAMGLNISGYITGASLIEHICCGKSNGYISGVKYHDRDCDGERDNPQNTGAADHEEGLEGWEITLCDADGNPLENTYTDQFGFYTFNDVPPGNYYVKETPQPDWEATNTNSQQGWQIMLDTAEIQNNIDFANKYTGPVELDASLDCAAIGENNPIRWIGGECDCEIKLELINCDDPAQSPIIIVENYGNIGSYDWTASDIPPGIYQIKITAECSTSMEMDMDMSDCFSVINIEADFTAELSDCGMVSFTATSSPPAVDYDWNFGDATTDNGNPVTHQYFAEGPYTVSLTVTTADGCEKTISQNISPMVDTVPPSIIDCPVNNIELVNSPGICGTTVNALEFNAVDNCGVDEIICTHQSGDFFELGTTEVICTATDIFGNETMCEFAIIVNDVESPVAVCNPLTVILDGSGQAIVLPEMVGSATDNCGLESLVVSPPIINCMAACDDNTVTLIATDVSGNIGDCLATINIIDNIPPAINCPPDITINDGDPFAPSNTGQATFMDNCPSSVGLSYDDLIIGNCPAGKTIERTWTAVDGCGNEDMCLQTIYFNCDIGCCSDTLAFCDRFSQGFYSTNIECQILVEPVALDTCDQMIIDWGDMSGAQVLGNEIATHIYAESGDYEICITANMLNSAGDICIGKDTCWTVCVECGGCEKLQWQNLWAKSFGNVPGGISNQLASGALSSVVHAFDMQVLGDDMYIAGSVRGDEFDGHAIPENGGLDAFFAKYDLDGNIDWVWSMGGEQNDGITSIQVDPMDGSIYVGGWFKSNIFIVPSADPIHNIELWKSSSTSTIDDGFIAKYDAALNLQWAYSFGNIGYDMVLDMAIDHDQNLLVTGSFSFNVGFYTAQWGASGIGPFEVDETDVFILKLDPDGNHMWHQTFGAPQWRDWGNAIAVDENNDIYVTGEFRGDMILNGLEIMSVENPSGSWEAFVMKFAEDGEYGWGFDIGATDVFPVTNAGNEIEIYEDKLIITGVASGQNIDFNPNGISNIQSGGNSFLACYNLDNSNPPVAEWAFLLPLNGKSNDFAVDGNGNIAITGFSYQQLLDFDPSPNMDNKPGAGVEDIFIAKYDIGGNYIEAVVPAGSKYEQAHGIEWDGEGNVIVIGKFGSPDFDPEPYDPENALFNAGVDGEIFMGKYTCFCRDDASCCDDLSVSFEEIPGDTCCYDISLENNSGTSITSVQAVVLTDGWSFTSSHINDSDGYEWGYVSGQILSVTHENGTIPTGALDDVFGFCLAPNDMDVSGPVQVVINWFEGIPGKEQKITCPDTLEFNCTIIDTFECLAFDFINAECNQDNPLQYDVYYTVTNMGDDEIMGILLQNLTEGFVFGECNGGNMTYDVFYEAINLPPDETSGTLCVSIFTSQPILSEIELSLTTGYIGTECCHSIVEQHFIIEPCCQPCENLTSTIELDTLCCYSYSLENNCKFPYFSSVQLQLEDVGITFASFENGDSYNWIINDATENSVQLYPVEGFIPPGIYEGVLNFCLEGATSEYTDISIVYNTLDGDGNNVIACEALDSIVCEEIDTCAVLSNIMTEYDEMTDLYTVTFDVVNNTGYDANYVLFSSPYAGVLFENDFAYFNPAIEANGGQETVTMTFELATAPPNDSMVFTITLKGVDGTDCCFENDSICVALPNCNPCCQASEDFIQTVENSILFSFNQSECLANLGIFLDSCIMVEYIDWGDGSPLQSNPFADGTFNPHIYPETGIYTLHIKFMQINPATGEICGEYIATRMVDMKCVNAANEQDGLSGINIFPNPFSNAFTISFKIPTTEPLFLTLIDVHGRTLYAEKIPAGTRQWEIQANEIPPGIYWVCMMDAGGGIVFNKVVKG